MHFFKKIGENTLYLIWVTERNRLQSYENFVHTIRFFYLESSNFTSVYTSHPMSEASCP